MSDMEGFRDDPDWREVAALISDIKNTLIKIPYEIEDEHESEEAT